MAPLPGLGMAYGPVAPGGGGFGLGSFSDPVSLAGMEDEDYLEALQQQYLEMLQQPGYVPRTVEPPELGQEELGRFGLGQALTQAGAGILGAGIGNYSRAMGAAGIGFTEGMNRGMELEKRRRQLEYQNKLDLVAQETRSATAKERETARRSTALKGLSEVAKARDAKSRREIAADQFNEALVDIDAIDPETATLIRAVHASGETDKAAQMVADLAKDLRKTDTAKPAKRTKVSETHVMVEDPTTGEVWYERHPDAVLEEYQGPVSPEEAFDRLEDLKEKASAIAVGEVADQPAGMEVPNAALVKRSRQVLVNQILDSPELYGDLEPFLSRQEKVLLEEEKARRAGVAPQFQQDQEMEFEAMDALLGGG